jgi:Zn-dependent protease with chaperone function
MKGGGIMKKSLIFALALVFFAMTVMPALAQLNTGIEYGTYTGLGTKDLREGVMAIVRVLLGFLGIIAIVILLYGGFVWLTSAGNEEKVGQAKKVITSAIIGLVIVFISYAIAQFVITQLLQATGAPGY